MTPQQFQQVLANRFPPGNNRGENIKLKPVPLAAAIAAVLIGEEYAHKIYTAQKSSGSSSLL